MLQKVAGGCLKEVKKHSERGAEFGKLSHAYDRLMGILNTSLLNMYASNPKTIGY